MKIGIAWEKREWGGSKPTWRPAIPFFNNMGQSKCFGRSIRVMTNRQTKRYGLEFTAGYGG